MRDIYVDGDACPVKAEVLKVAERYDLMVYLVSNRGLRPGPNPKVKNILVAEGADAADDWIAEHIGSGDVAVTADIPLADRCLKRGAKVLDPMGREFTPDSIGATLATRDLMTHLRETGDIQGGGRAFSAQDRSQFLQTLDAMLQT